MKEIMGSLPFTKVSKKIYYLGINLTKKAKDFYSGNLSLKKGIEKDTRRWEDI